jgi:hypothetical protein
LRAYVSRIANAGKDVFIKEKVLAEALLRFQPAAAQQFLGVGGHGSTSGSR